MIACPIRGKKGGTRALCRGRASYRTDDDDRPRTPFLRLKNSRIWERQISKTDYSSLPSGPRGDQVATISTTLQGVRRGMGVAPCLRSQTDNLRLPKTKCSNGVPEHEKYAPKDYELELAVLDLRVRHTTACAIILRLDSSLAGADPLRRGNHFDR